MSDSHKHSHGEHHHHHRYEGPRSTQAKGLSDEYGSLLTEDSLDMADIDQINEQIANQKFSEELNRTLEEQLAADIAEYDEIHADKKLTKEELKNKKRRQKRSKKAHTDAWNRSQRRSRHLLTFFMVLIGILLAIILAFLILRFKGEMDLKKSVVETPVTVELPEEAAEDENDENLIVYNGERYWYNEDIITILCIGVDRQVFASPDEMVIGGNGQADADFLVIMDKKTGKISILNISRDCMVDIDRYNDQGQYIDTRKEQLCLSFAFGNGKQTSCENTALSVSRLLYGMPINAYVAIDFESIGTLNDAVGGVSVPVTEEIADKFPGTQVGSLVKLVGSEAVTYVRSRDTALLDSNNARMSRQKQYLLAFIKTLLQELKSDPTKALSLYNSVTDNMVTSIKLSEVTYFATFFVQNGFKEENMSSVQGEVVMGEDGFAEFIPDDKALFETVLNLYYIKE